MPDDYRISDLSTAPSIGNSDLMELSVVNTASETGYTSMKAPVLNLANKIVNATQYVSDLQTQNKTITGAINEIAQGGGGGGGDADIVKTASGNPCSFSTSLTGELKSLTADIVCGGGGGTPSTPIPIVGHSELNLTRCGKNLFDKSTIIDGFWIRPNGTTDYSPNRMYSDLIRIKPNTQYYITNTIGGNDFFSTIHYDSNLNIIGAKNVGGSGDVAGTITSYNESAYMRINSFLADLDTLMVSEGNTATEYEPYNGQTFTVAFGQTVYGGVYDKSGRLTIDTVKVVLDGTQPIGFINWQPNTNTRAWIYFLATFPDLKDYEITDLNISSCKLKSDKLQTVTYQGTNGIYSNDIPSISIVGGDYWSIAVRVNDTSLETDTAINNYLSQNPIEVCYEIATPIVIDVPSISVSAENGVNNIVSDGGGDVDVEYYTDLAEDIKDFIGDGVEVGDLANVEITTPSNNQVLKYDATSQKWVNGNSSGGYAHNYSTTEQVVGTWVDGSPVYEKTFVVNNPSTGNNTITHNISNLDMLISVGGFAKMADGYQQPFNFISNADDFKWNILVLDFGSTDFTLQIGVNYTSTKAISKAVVTLRYTKSTS